jgi:hypothetical protein
VFTGDFTLPANGEAGGVPSGTESYYSFDWANVHFICLDSQGSSRAPTGTDGDLAPSRPRSQPLRLDHRLLAPPAYSKGSHDSDTEAQLVEMRTKSFRSSSREAWTWC